MEKGLIRAACPSPVQKSHSRKVGSSVKVAVPALKDSLQKMLIWSLTNRPNVPASANLNRGNPDFTAGCLTKGRVVAVWATGATQLNQQRQWVGAPISQTPIALFRGARLRGVERAQINHDYACSLFQMGHEIWSRICQPPIRDGKAKPVVTVCIPLLHRRQPWNSVRH